MSYLQTRIPDDLKKKVDTILKQMGLDMSTAIRMYFTKIAQTKKIPFEISSIPPENSTKNSNPHHASLREEKNFWNAIATDNMKDIWSSPDEDIWDELYKDTPSIKKL